jgi:nitrate reductase NapE component
MIRSLGRVLRFIVVWALWVLAVFAVAGVLGLVVWGLQLLFGWA